MLPSCFSHPNTTSSGSQKVPQSLITCIYQAQLCNSPAYLTVTWSKALSSHSLTIYAPNSFPITVPLQPSTFSFFRNRQGSKSVHLTPKHWQRFKLYWDFTRVEFTHNSAEPESCFYLAISRNGRLEFFLGDLQTELTRRTGLVVTSQFTEPALLSRREHVFGSEIYISRAKFLGSKHEIAIECNNGGALVVKIDGEIRLVIKRLAWKFRGNERIYVGGIEMEFYWDVFSWVNNENGGAGGNGSGHGVFIFQVGDGGVWPEMMGPEKRLMRRSLSSVGPASTPAAPASLSPSPSCSGVLQWAEESISGDSGKSSCSSSTWSCGSNGGFSLALHAWRKD